MNTNQTGLALAGAMVALVIATIFLTLYAGAVYNGPQTAITAAFYEAIGVK